MKSLFDLDDKLKHIGHQIPSDWRELFQLLTQQRRNIRRHVSRLRYARQLGSVMQHPGRAKMISQIFKRQKLIAQLQCNIKVFSLTSGKKHLTQPRRNASRTGCEARQLPIAHVDYSRTLPYA